ncbi:MAG: type II toxin-antitoxin system RelE/ParE family toxin [Methanosarcinaceae archaeon]|nr:type II toxin-antitoxin system RelE/ParE family toxin [Methanosarcinaceae archaeon]
MPYTIIYSSRAAKHLEKLPSDITLKVIESISELKYDPYRQVHKMKGHSEYRYRIGQYRAIIDINDKEGIIEILMVGHRSKVNRNY